MFVGASKNIGGGFRIGVGTRIGGGKKQTQVQLKDKEFQNFLQTVQNDMNKFLITFIEANNKDFKEIEKAKIDLNEVFKENEDYKEFIELYQSVKNKIDKVIYMGESGLVAKKHITNELFELKNFIETKYPNFEPKYKINKSPFSIIKKIGKYFLIFMAIMFVLGIISQGK